MDGSILGQTWDNLSIWRKSALAIFFVMWVAFSSGIISLAYGNLVALTVFLCILWLGFVVVSYLIVSLESERY